MKSYEKFLASKRNEGANHGFQPVFMPDGLFDFQKHLVDWSLRKGRGALFEDCGLGKTYQFLVWAENVHRHTNKPVLILAPLAVSAQIVREANKFDMEITRSYDDGVIGKGVTVTNYEQLHRFSSGNLAGVVCDESSILKSFDGTRRKAITSFMRKIPYRLLATATAAPNDYTELGTSSEALGYMGHMDMLNRFFKNDTNNSRTKRMYGEAVKWRFKGYAEIPFWRWVTSWAKAIRKPSDIGYENKGFDLPPLNIKNHLIDFEYIPNGELFSSPAMTLRTQREESKRSITERCEKVAELVSRTGNPALIWCHRNEEGDLLESLIDGSVQVAGKHSDAVKETRLMAFADQEARVLITKPRIGAWGLNFQHCSHVCYFPSHSYEAFYQSIRRCWRFGQKHPVTVDVVLTPGEERILANLEKKSQLASLMFENLVNEMNNSLSIDHSKHYSTKLELPQWL